MNEPKPLYRCDLCKAVDYEDPVIGCKRCGFDEMQPIPATPKAAPAAVSAVDWLNGSPVDEQGRLILSRDYIVSCLQALSSPPSVGEPK